MLDIGTLKLKTAIDESGLNKFAASAGKTIAKAGKVALAGITAVGAGLTAFSKQAISAYGEFEQIAGTSELIFGEAFDELKEKAQDAYKTAGMSASEYMDMANSVSATMKAQGVEQDMLLEKTDSLSKSVSDLSAAYGVEASKAMDIVSQASVGVFSHLGELTKGYDNAQGAAQLAAEASEYFGRQLDENNIADFVDMLEYYNQKMGLTGKAAAEATSTIQGATQALKASYDNFITAFAGGDSEEIKTALSDLLDSIDTEIEVLAPRIEAIGSSVSDFFWAGLHEAVNGLAIGMRILDNNSPEELCYLVTGYYPEALMWHLSYPFTHFLEENEDQLNTISDTFSKWIERFDAGDMVTKVSNKASEILESVSDSEAFKTALSETVEFIIEFSSDLLLNTDTSNLEYALGEVLGHAFVSAVRGVFSGLWDEIKKIFNRELTGEELGDILIEWGKKGLHAVKLALIPGGTLAENIKSGFVDAAYQDIYDFFIQHTADWIEIGNNIVDKILTGLKQAWADVVAWVEEKIKWFQDKLSNFSFSSLDSNPHSNAIGADYIPYDGYRAVLHKGERILTASEVDQLESSDITSASNTFYITVPNNPNALETALTLRDMVTDAHYGLA